jgi:hypothetical protein
MESAILPSPCLSVVPRLLLVPFPQVYAPKPLAVLTILVLCPSPLAAYLDELCLGMYLRVPACRYQRKTVAIL